MASKKTTTRKKLSGLMGGDDAPKVEAPKTLQEQGTVEPKDDLDAPAPPRPTGTAKETTMPAESTTSIPIPAASAKPNTGAIVMGPAANDPTTPRGRGPLPMTALLYTGVAGIRPPVNAGFQTWAKMNGHTEHTREAWDALFEEYKTSPVRS